MNKFFTHLLSGLIFTGLVLLSYISDAQYFAVGQDPGSIKWRQIQTNDFQIIYPDNYEKEAQRIAHIFENVYRYSGITLHHTAKKISVILHTKTIKSNGFVAWAPSRVELFPTPSQDTYAQEWIEQLAIHELRHSVQIDKIETELPAIFRILLGEQAASLVIGAYLPFWFLEGDAVVTETALSHSGRGRLPSFTMELKAQADEQGIFSFDKAYLGSYKDYIPDYYQLGYQMVSNIRNLYSGDIWSKVLHHIARNPLALNSLSKGLKLATGKNQDELYRQIMNSLKRNNPFKLGIQGDTTNIGRVVVNVAKDYASYRYPFFVNDSLFVALKISLQNIPNFVLVDENKNEKRIFTPGTLLDESVGYSNSKLIWIEPLTDPRWTHKERSMMRILDIRSGELSEKTFEEKLSAPMISPDGKIISAVRINDQNHCSIILLNIDNKQIIKEFQASGTNTFLTPTWSPDNENLNAIELGSEGKSIIRINIVSGSIHHLTVPVYGEISKPIQWNNFLFYTADQQGKDEGFAMDLTKQKKYLIATGKYGLKDLQCSGDGFYLLYADYSSKGFKIARKMNIPSKWAEVDLTHWFVDSLAGKLTDQEKGVINFSDLDTTQYLSSNYSKIKHLINIHSWSPVYIDPDQSYLNTGFSIISQNKLSTAITQFGYDYSTINHNGKFVGKFEYSGFYPVWKLYGDYGKENSHYYQINRHYNSRNVVIGQDTVLVPYTKRVMNLNLDVSIPFDFSHGKMNRLIQPEIQFGYSFDWQEATTPISIFRGSYVPLTFRLYAYNLRQQSVRDLQPKWGQIIDLSYRSTPLGDRQLGTIAAANGTLFLPGLFNNHGIKLYAGYQKKVSENTYFNDLIYYPRGYASIENKTLFTFRSDYCFSLGCPDWHIGRLYYLKRLSLRIHYDWARIDMPIYQASGILSRTLNSTGGELISECHLLRFIAPVNVGIRESFLIDSKVAISELIFSVNLKQM